MSSIRNYSLSHVRVCAYFLTLLGILWFAEMGWFFPRSLRIESINKMHSKSDDGRVFEMALEYPECKGKEKLLEILLHAGMGDLSVEDCKMLPTWNEVASLYGEEPIVHGLETCERYRSAISAEANGGNALEPEPRVGGMFNTGTNAFEDALDLNFKHFEDKLTYQLRGGKHVRFQGREWTKNLTSVPTFLPVVLIRDPFRWMASMCKASYVSSWRHGLPGHCPNLVPSKGELRFKRFQDVETFVVDVARAYEERYDSLADMWSEWNREFVDADFPRLIIRFEDTLFHAEKVMQIVSECVGKPMQEPYKYHLAASKTHGSPADFSTALAKYGSERGRYDGMAAEDKAYVRTALDPTVMKLFHYRQVPQAESGYIYNEEIKWLVSNFKVCRGKERLLDILMRAGQNYLSRDDCIALPTWDEVRSLYGDDPIIQGLETCQKYRNGISENGTGGQALEPAPRVAGMFNTGTGFFLDSLDLNFMHNEDKYHYVLQGGMHVRLRERAWSQNYSSNFRSNSNITLPFLPVVLIRDPFRWMASMCEDSFRAKWMFGLEGHCPNLVPTKQEKNNYERFKDIETFSVVVDRNYEERYDSLADYWSEWYREFVDADFPRLIIRFEDILFHPDRVMELVSECVGARMKKPFLQYYLAQAQASVVSDFARVLAESGTEKGRYSGFALEDKVYANTALDSVLLEKFHYPRVPAAEMKTISEQIASLVTEFKDVCFGKEHLLKILLIAGKEKITSEDCQAMPTWNEVTSLYGDEPVVLGLETCERYRATISAEANGGRSLDPDPRVAGLFDTGTNALVDSLDLNFRHVEDRLHYNVPWGKHSLLGDNAWAQNHTHSNLPFLPIVLVRDPFRWMAGMCKSPYTAHWMKGLDDHCPNLVPSDKERQSESYIGVETFTVQVDHPNEPIDDINEPTKYDSLADMWSKWNRAYVDADFPRLIIRFEDTLFHAEKVMQIVSDCVGKKTKRPFRYHMDKAKSGPSSDFPTALGKYGRENGRYDGLTKEDMEYAATALAPDLLKTFHYLPTPSDTVES